MKFFLIFIFLDRPEVLLLLLILLLLLFKNAMEKLCVWEFTLSCDGGRKKAPWTVRIKARVDQKFSTSLF